MPRPAWLAVGAAAGALGLGAAPGPAIAVFGVAVVCAAAALRAGRLTGARPGLLPLGVGILAIGLRAALGGEVAVAPGPVPGGEGPWIGTVQSVGAPRAGSRPATVRLEGEMPVLVAATLPWYPPVVPNDRVELRGRVRAPPPDDYGAYLVRIGAVGTLRADALELLPAEGTVAGSLEGFRRSAADGIDRSIPEPEAGLAAGVLIGLRDRVDRELAAAFTTAGASHVVAISGWNIAIVASTLGAIAGGMQRRRRAILTALAIIAYVVFVGPSPSVVRAGAMAGVALLARELGRPGTAAAALGWACAVLLLIDPAFIDDAGFRLSVLATAGILAWGSSLTARMAGAEPGRLRRWIAEILGVSFAAQAATTPIVLLEFGRLSLVAPAVNLVVVPLVPPAMAAGALALVVGMTVGLGAPAFVATIVGLPAWALYAAMVGVVRAGAALPLASLELTAPWDAVSAVAALALIVGAARWGDRVVAYLRAIARAREAHRVGIAAAGGGASRRASAGSRASAGATGTARARHGGGNRHSRASRVAIGALVGATIGLSLVVAHRPDGIARVVVLDVGQGDGILVEGGRGGRMVVDGGPDPGRLLIALDERLPPWDRRIDILVLTHPHEDHVAGLALLLDRYRVGRVYEPGMLGSGPGYRAWAAVLAAAGTPHGRLSTGDRLALDAIRFRVLWPDANRVPERPPDSGTVINNVSIVLLGEVGQRRFLLAGDVEEGVDPELLGRGLPTVDLLKVAHHGSRTATTREFLEAVRPRVAVVSAGAGNPYGHPATATIERLAELAGRTYRTDTDGIVEVAFDGGVIRVRTSGPRPAPPRVTPRPTARPGAANTVLASSAVRGDKTWAATPFFCGIPAPVGGAPGGGGSEPVGQARVAEPPTAPEAPRPITARLGGADRAAPEAGITRLGRIPAPRAGLARPSGYHRPDGDLPGIGDRAGPRDRSPRLLLGRRRVRPRSRARRVSRGHRALSGRPAGALATRDRSGRARPPPR